MPLALLLFMFLSVMTVTTLSTLVYSVSENDREIAANQAIAAVDSGLAEAAQSLATLNKFACQVPGQTPTQYTVSADDMGAFRWWADKSQLDEGLVTLVSEGQSANAAGAGTRVSSQTYRWDDRDRSWSLVGRQGAQSLEYPSTEEILCAPVWSEIPLTSPWLAYNTASYFTPEYAHMLDDTIAFRGAVRSGVEGSQVGSIPAEARPSKPHYFRVDCMSNAWGVEDCEVRVNESGVITLVDAPGAQTLTRLSLDNIRYPLGNAGWKNLTYANGWVSADASNDNVASYKRFRDDTVGVRGKIRKTSGTTFGTVAFTLPMGFRPQEPHTFSAGVCSPATGSGVCHVRVEPNGDVIPESSSISDSTAITLNLDHIRFDVGDEDWFPPTLENAWSSVDTDSPVGYRLYPDTSLGLRGTLRSGAGNTVAFTLPEGHRPDKRQAFVVPCLVGSSDTSCTVEVRPNGEVRVIAPSGSVAAIYLDGVRLGVGETSAPSASETVQPSTPTGLSASNQTAVQIQLNWTASANAESYLVYRDGQLISSSVTTMLVDGGLSPNSNYSYAVRAVNSAGQSELSTPLNASTGSSAVNNFLVSSVNGPTRASFTWTPPAGGASSYAIARRANMISNPTWSANQSASVSSQGNGTYVVTSAQVGSTPGVMVASNVSVASNTSYNFEINGFKAEGTSAYLYVGNAGTGADINWAQVPLTSSNGRLTASFNSGTATAVNVGVLFTTPVVGSAFTVSQPSLSPASSGYTAVGGGVAGNANSATVGDLPGSAQTFRLEAINPGGTSGTHFAYTNGALPVNLLTSPVWISGGSGAVSISDEGGFKKVVVTNPVSTPGVRLESAGFPVSANTSYTFEIDGYRQSGSANAYVWIAPYPAGSPAQVWSSTNPTLIPVGASASRVSVTFNSGSSSQLFIGVLYTSPTMNSTMWLKNPTLHRN